MKVWTVAIGHKDWEYEFNAVVCAESEKVARSIVERDVKERFDKEYTKDVVTEIRIVLRSFSISTRNMRIII